MHVRTALRSACVTALSAAPAVAPSILVSRRAPIDIGRAPVVTVRTPEETSRRGSMGAAAALEREVDLIITASVTTGARGDVDAAADAMAAAIETRLATHAAFAAAVLAATLIETRIDAPSVQSDRPLAELSLRYRCLIRTAINDPSTRI